jgi:hypothetical protein
MKKLLTIIFLTLAINTFCQTGKIVGNVRNGIESTPSKFMSIGLYQNDMLIEGTISDSTGHFEFNNIASGIFKLGISFVGYQPYNIPEIVVFNDSIINLEIKYPCPNGNKKSKKICPYGHRNNIIPIEYGLPSMKRMKRAEKGKCDLGGCIVTECDPKWYCKEHKIRF